MRGPISNLGLPKGFTLLEVVVAMAIVGLGVVTLLEIFSSGLRLETRSLSRTEATAYGRQVMDELLARRSLDGPEAGSFGEKLRWRLETQPVGGESGLFSPSGWELKEISLHLRYRDGERERGLEIKTLRLSKKKNP